MTTVYNLERLPRQAQSPTENHSPGGRPRTGGLYRLLLLLWLPAALPALADEGSQAAVLEGNQLFRNGQIAEAVETYMGGYSPESPHPTLLYNLGTALHHLDRLPEAILWYRRAAGSDDPWLQENLWLARRSLGSQTLAPAGALGWLSQNPRLPTLAAVVVSWVTLLFIILGPRGGIWPVVAGGLLTLGLLGAGAAVRHWGLQPAVMLQDCSTALGDLPAGTEAWVRRGTDGTWLVSGAGTAGCPDDSLALVAPTIR